MDTVVILSMNWGPKHGGINAFNQDLCHGLANICKNRLNVVCLVSSATEYECRDARERGVILLPLIYRGQDEIMSPSDAAATLSQNRIPLSRVLLWIGHDRFTGAAACSLAVQAGGKSKSAVIRHMDYILYESLRSGGDAAFLKMVAQEEIFRACDIPLAVGPLLADSTRAFFTEEEDKPVTMLVPGLPTIQSRVSGAQQFTGITFGRCSKEVDPIKEVSLSMEAFNRFSEKARALNHNVSFTFQIFGQTLSASDNDEDTGVEKLLRESILRGSLEWTNNVACSYTENRALLFARVAQCSVCLMPSRHEGFGLVGWEAIAASVPLMASVESGLYRLLESLKLHHLVTPIQPFEPDPAARAVAVEHLSEKLLDSFVHREVYKNNARELLRALQQQNTTWEKTARTLLDAAAIPPDNHPRLIAARTLLANGQDTLPANHEAEPVRPRDNGKEPETTSFNGLLNGSRLLAVVGPQELKIDLLGDIAAGFPRTLNLDPRSSLDEALSDFFSIDAWKHDRLDTLKKELEATLDCTKTLLVLEMSDVPDTRFFHSSVLGLLNRIQHKSLKNTVVLLNCESLPESLGQTYDISSVSPPGYDDWRTRLLERMHTLDPEETDALNTLAITCFGLRVATLSRLLKIPDSGDTRNVLEKLEGKGLVRLHEGRWDIPLAEKGVVLSEIPEAKRLPLKLALADLLEKHCDILKEVTSGDIDDVSEWIFQVDSLRDEKRHRRSFNIFYKKLRFSLFYRKGELTLFLSLLNALADSGKSGLRLNKTQQADHCLLLGQTLTLLDNASDALDYLNDYIENTNTSRRYDLAKAHSKIALACYVSGNYAQCHANLVKTNKYISAQIDENERSGTAHDVFRKECLLRKAYTLRSLAKLYIQTKSFDKAKEYLARATDLFQRVSCSQGLVKTCLYYADICLWEGKNEAARARRYIAEAQKHLDDCIEAGNRFDVRDGIAITLGHARWARANGYFAEAEAKAATSFDLCAQNGGIDIRLDALTERSRGLLGKKDYRLAQTVAQKAYRLALFHGHRYKAAEALTILASADAFCHLPREAEHKLTRATALASKDTVYRPQLLLDEIADVGSRLRPS